VPRPPVFYGLNRLTYIAIRATIAAYMGSGTITREQMKLLLQPAVSHTKKLRRFDMSVSWIGLLGAALIYASINIPAIMAVNRAGDQRLAPAQIVSTVDTAEAAPVETTEAEITTPAPTPIAELVFHYDKVGISAPVEWEVTYSAKNLKVALQSGLAHVKGSALPGSNGTALITGHSSNLGWAKGSYKTVFAPLLKSELDDKFSVQYNGTTYEYQVTEVYEVDPGQVELLAGKDGVAMRLITCTPLGTDKRRLIIDAKQLNPEQSGSWQANTINASLIVATR